MEQISYSQFQRYTGLNRTRVSEGLRGLLQKSLIYARRNGQYISYGPCELVPKGNQLASTVKGLVPKGNQNQYQNGTETSTVTVHTKERKERKDKDMEAPKKAPPLSKASSPKKSPKKVNPFYKEAVAYWFELWREKYEVKGSWGQKEGMLLNRDLKKLEGNKEFSALKIIKELMDMFFNDKPENLEWFNKEDYAGFSFCIDYLLKECR